MLDPNLLRNKLDLVAEKLARRQFKLDVENIRNQEQKRKILQIETESLQAKRNTFSKAIGFAKSCGKDIKSLCNTVKQLSRDLSNIKVTLKILQSTIRKYALSIPNIPADEVPNGIDNNDNVEILRWAKPRQYNFSIRDHLELGEKINGLDFSSAVKLAGSRFVVMKGQVARLHRALTQFMIDLHTEQHGYIEYYLPYLTNHNSLYGAGQLPKFTEDLFHLQPINHKSNSSSYALISTAEVPLTNLVRNIIIEEDNLPLKITAHTPCFRSEAGSYGKNTRGLMRLHQFDKIELVQIVKPVQSMQALEELTGHAEKVLQLLQLPYRKVLLCTGDMSFASCKTYDLEVWLPAQNSYVEVSSCSNIGDFQARRMQARYRSRINKKIHLVHTINGSGLAVGRTLAAVLENHQLSDGRIKVPSVLKPYMNGMSYID